MRRAVEGFDSIAAGCGDRDGTVGIAVLPAAAAVLEALVETDARAGIVRAVGIEFEFDRAIGEADAFDAGGSVTAVRTGPGQARDLGRALRRLGDAVLGPGPGVS